VSVSPLRIVRLRPPERWRSLEHRAGETRVYRARRPPSCPRYRRRGSPPWCPACPRRWRQPTQLGPAARSPAQETERGHRGKRGAAVAAGFFKEIRRVIVEESCARRGAAARARKCRLDAKRRSKIIGLCTLRGVFGTGPAKTKGSSHNQPTQHIPWSRSSLPLNRRQWLKSDGRRRRRSRRRPPAHHRARPRPTRGGPLGETQRARAAFRAMKIPSAPRRPPKPRCFRPWRNPAAIRSPSPRS